MSDWAYYRAAGVVDSTLGYLEPVRDYNRTLLVKRIAEALRKARTGVPTRTAAILYWRARGYTLEEIAQVYGVTRERIRQIECKGHRCVDLRVMVGSPAKAADPAKRAEKSWASAERTSSKPRHSPWRSRIEP